MKKRSQEQKDKAIDFVLNVFANNQILTRNEIVKKGEDAGIAISDADVNEVRKQLGLKQRHRKTKEEWDAINSKALPILRDNPTISVKLLAEKTGIGKVDVRYVINKFKAGDFAGVSVTNGVKEEKLLFTRFMLLLKPDITRENLNELLTKQFGDGLHRDYISGISTKLQKEGVSLYDNEGNFNVEYIDYNALQLLDSTTLLNLSTKIKQRVDYLTGCCKELEKLETIFQNLKRIMIETLKNEGLC